MAIIHVIKLNLIEFFFFQKKKGKFENDVSSLLMYTNVLYNQHVLDNE